MGAKITIDSGDAHEQGARGHRGPLAVRRRARPGQIVVHPQSIVHSMVEYVDGSVIAQLGVADMGMPILYALTYPERRPTPAPRLDLTRLGALDLLSSRTPTSFPCLRLARTALETRRDGPSRAERRQRDRGGRVPRPAHRLHGTSPSSSSARSAAVPAASLDIDRAVRRPSTPRRAGASQAFGRRAHRGGGNRRDHDRRPSSSSSGS